MGTSNGRIESAEPAGLNEKELDNTVNTAQERLSFQKESLKNSPDSTDSQEIRGNGDISDENIRSAETDEDDNHQYPPKWRLVLITTAMCLSVFCMALDNNIIATAIPKITDQFRAVADVGWYGTAYLFMTCSLQLVYGNLYTFFSLKWTFLCALFLFELGSFVCAITPTSIGLIFGRAVAGMGAAGIYSGATMIISYSVPLRQRSSFMGFLGAMYGIASVVGPLLGGAFTDRLTWRWCFYINLPFGAITALFIILYVQNDKKESERKSTFIEQVRTLDPEGTVLFVGGIICLLLALQWGGTAYAWGNARIIVLLIISVLAFIAFIAVQIWKQDRATVPPRVFKNRSVWACCVFSACLGASFFVIIFYLPLWFQAVKGTSAVKSGIMNLPMILALVVFSMIGGILVTILGHYVPFMYASAILMGIGGGLLSTFQPDTGHAKWIGYQVLYGAGVGIGMQQTMVAIQASLPAADRAIGTAIMMCVQILGGTIFIGVAQNVFQNRLVSNIANSHIGGLSGKTIINTGATQIRNLVSDDELPTVVSAYNDALMQTFYVAVAMGSLSIIGAIFVEWHSVKKEALDKKDTSTV